MQRLLLVAAALLGATGVLAGAFAAHALSETVSPGDLAIWETAARYQLLHAVALVAVLIHSAQGSVHRAAALMLLGTMIFSGSLYLLVLTGIRLLGAITPIGGVMLVCAWLWWAKCFWQNGHPYD